MPLVRANRDKIDDRFSVLGFTIRTESPLYEVGVATDPALFRAENRPRRNRRNFFSSRSYGVLRARRGEAVYMVPPDVLAQFVGQPRLYFGLATYREGSGGVPDFVQAPTAGNMYVDLSGLTERGLRRLAARPGAAYGGNGGNDASLDWGGDAQPQAPAVAAPVKTVQTAAPAPAHAPYDDGFGDFPAHPAMPAPAPQQPLPPAAASAAPNPAPAPKPAAQGLGYYGYGRALEDDADDDASIDGIPDSEALSLSLSATPDYPGASRFVPAHASNYRASASPRTVDKIVIHITDGGRKIDGTIAWFQNGNQTTASGKVIHVSAHYVVGQDGEVVQMVRNNDIAWHAGSANRSSIGIEHVANTKGLIPTDAQYRASADLVAWLCGQYGLPLDRVHVLGHAEADSKTTHRACPNAVWDWDKYMGYVRASGAAPRSQGLAYDAYRARPAASRGLEVPLTPADGAGVCIDTSALQPADIIVSTARHPVSYAIRAGTVSAISHAMLYVGNGNVIEAVGSGVREVPLTQAIDSAILAVAYRHPSVDAATAAAIVSYARSKVGSPYNYSGVAYTGYRAINPVGAKIIQKIADVAGVNIGQAGALYCSELVFESFSHAGLPLTAQAPNASTPDDIVQLSRGLLQYVGHLKGEDVFLGIALSLGSQSSRALASESFSLHWPNVPYIAQVSNSSCWAAATAMLVSWRDNVSISDREVADRVGIADAYDNGLLPEDRPTLARAFNLVAEAPASYGISDFRRLLQSYGPLFLDMTNSRGEGGHAWILVGMSSDGAEDGSDTMMYLHNPTRSRGKVKWSFPDFLKFYQNRVDTSGGVLPCQILHSAAIPSGRQTVNAAQFAVGLGLECFSVHWPDVPYIEQTSDGSCWAAATAMIVGWRDSVSISDQSIADRVGIADAYEHGLWPKDRPALAAAWNLVDEPPASYPIGEFRRMLESYGPIFLDMTNSRGEKGHAWVLVGMTSDGAEDGSDTVMYLHNPTASRGKVKWKFPDFLKLYENRVNTSGGVLPCQILHARAIPAGKRPGTAAQFALGLATPRALENESFSIHWPDVPYITQKSDASCWAAATAMVVSWRDLNPNLTDKAIADATPLPGAYDDGLDPADRPVVAAAWNLSSEAPASYGIYDFRRMLERYGPLYLSLTNSKGEGGHAWVLVGMTSDGAADGSDTMMYLHNPTASRGKVKWSFPAFLRLYERRVDTSGGVLPCQIMHAKAVPAGRQPVNAAQFALGLAAYEPPLPRGATPPIHHLTAAAMAGGDTIEYPVHLIPQPDKLSCWAASMAMLLSFRRNQSISPETLANEVGSSLRTSYNWDLLNAVKAKYGFNAIAQPSNASLYNSPNQWADWLKSQGPLWVVIVGMPHAVVISGIKGDLNDPAQCQVKILNPWDTRIDFDGDEVDFHPANHGYADWLPFNDFASDFGNMATPNYGNWRVLTLPAAASQGLAWNDCSKPRVRGLAAPPAAVRALGMDVSSGSLGGEPIDPPRIVGTRMARQRGAKGRTTWALDQLEGVKQANPSPAVVAALTPTTVVLNDWPHLDQDPVPLPLTVSFDAGGGGVGNVRISAGAAADLNYDVTVTATIEDEPQAGDQAAIRVTVDVDFANTAHGSLTARTLLKLYSNGRFDKDCRNL